MAHNLNHITDPMVPLTTIHLTFSATNLPNADIFSKSDPFLILYQQISDRNWLRIGHSEIQHDNLNPVFTTTFPISFQPNLPHQFKVEIYDFDSGDCLDLSKSERLGSAKFWLGTLLGSYNTTITTPLLTLSNKEIPNSILTIQGLEIANHNNLRARCTIKGLDYVKSALLGKDETVLEFIKVHNGAELVISKSPIIFDSQSPTYPTFLLDVGALCDEKFDQEFLVRVLYWKSDKEQIIMGQNVVTLADLVTTTPTPSPAVSPTTSPGLQSRSNIAKHNRENTARVIELYKPKRVDGATAAATPPTIEGIKSNLNLNKIKGKLSINMFQISRYPTYREYIQSGLEFSLSFHIDFSDTNSHWEQSTSPHWVDFSNKLDKNPYVSTIEDLGGIIQRYCGGTERIPPMYTRGFGAKVALEDSKTLSHSFPLSLTEQTLTAKNIRTVLGQYYYAVPRVEFYHPLKFAPSIDFATKIETPNLHPVNSFTFTPQQGTEANPASPFPRYHVAVLITNSGEIDDMKETIQALYTAAKTPISFIIVGVGDNMVGTNGAAQWKKLKKLDGDDQRTPLQVAKNDYIDRDIVQFIDFQQSSSDLLHLAHNVVAELPCQVLEYLWKNQLFPPGYDISPVVRNLTVSTPIQQEVDLIQSPQSPELRNPEPTAETGE